MTDDPENQVKDMAAVAFSALNRLNYLTSHPKVGLGKFMARSRTLLGVISGKNQYGSYNDTQWNTAGSNPRKMNPIDKSKWYLSNGVAYDILNGSIPDPFVAQGGTFGVRTRSARPLSKPFFLLPQLPGSNNDFFGMTQ